MNSKVILYLLFYLFVIMKKNEYSFNIIINNKQSGKSLKNSVSIKIVFSFSSNSCGDCCLSLTVYSLRLNSIIQTFDILSLRCKKEEIEEIPWTTSSLCYLVRV